MGRDIDFRDQGVANFFEGLASGANKIGVRAPATVAGDFDIELLAALPGVTSILTIDSLGQMGTTAVGAGDLNDAYDFPTAGAGRIITADAGAVEINGTGGLVVTTGQVQITGAGGLLVTTGQVEVAGAGGLLVSHTAPVYGLETTGAEYNFRLIAGLNTDKLEIQRGDQDGDISDDVFETLITFDAAGRFVGINTITPLETLHITTGGLATACRLRVQSDTNFDASVVWVENNLARYELGYDDSAGGFVLGRIDFTNPVMFVMDITGDVGINELVPNAKLHVTQDANQNALLIDKSGVVAGTALTVTNAGTGTTAELNHNGASGLALDLTSGSITGGVKITHSGDSIPLHIIMTGSSAAGLRIESASGAGHCLDLVQSANDFGMQIDAPGATAFPLINLIALATNSRGDIHFPTNRTADPSSPATGDMWYNATANTMKYFNGTVNVSF